MEDTAQEKVSLRAMMRAGFPGRPIPAGLSGSVCVRKPPRGDFSNGDPGTERNHWVLEMGMIRWTDLIGVAGFATAVLANLLLFPDSAEHMNWMYWLPGLALWFLGFGSVVGLLLCWSVRQFKDGPPPLLVLVGTTLAREGSPPPKRTEATPEMRRPPPSLT
jgi:hypothetical protein